MHLNHAVRLTISSFLFIYFEKLHKRVQIRATRKGTSTAV